MRYGLVDARSLTVQFLTDRWFAVVVFQTAVAAASELHCHIAMHDVAAWASTEGSENIAALAFYLARETPASTSKSALADRFDYDSLASAVHHMKESKELEEEAKKAIGDDPAKQAMYDGFLLECKGDIRAAERLYARSGLVDEAMRIKDWQEGVAEVLLPMELPRGGPEPDDDEED